MRGDITGTAAPQKQVTFKDCAPFTKYISKIDDTTIDDAENLDLVAQITLKQQEVCGFILR